jgi:predicted permease
MEMAYMLFQELIVLLLIGGIGFAIVRLGVLKEEDCKSLSSLVLYVFTPCAIIKSFQLPIDDQHVHGLALAIGFAVAVNLIWIFVNFLLKKKVPLTSVDELTLMYTNSGNLVYPLVAMIFGKEYLFYAAPYNAVMTCFVWTHGKAIIQESSNLDLKRVIKNVNILSIIIGIVLFFLQIKLPVLIETTMDLLGSMLGPASMIVIGMIMAGTNLKKVFTTAKLYVVCMGRLIVYPLIIIVLLALTGYTRAHPEDIFIFQIAMIAVTAPPANIIAQFAVMYNKDTFMAGAYNALGMLLCMVTMPLMMLLFNILIG